MSPETRGNQEANIHSWKDHNAIFPHKQPAEFFTTGEEGGYPKWGGEAVSCLTSELYLQKGRLSHAQEFTRRQKRSLKIPDLLKETWEVCPHRKTVTCWQVDIMARLKIHAVLEEIRYFECQMSCAGEYNRSEVGRGCRFQWCRCVCVPWERGTGAQMWRSARQTCFLAAEERSGKSSWKCRFT